MSDRFIDMSAGSESTLLDRRQIDGTDRFDASRGVAAFNARLDRCRVVPTVDLRRGRPFAVLSESKHERCAKFGVMDLHPIDVRAIPWPGHFVEAGW